MGHHHGHGGHARHDGTARAAVVTLLVNVALTALKWTAFAVTGSPSLFGEAAHSTADTMNPLLLWLGYRRSGRPAHDRHPLGHGREAFFWSLMAAQMMLVVGAVVTAAHGLQALRTGEAPHMSWWALGIMAFALLGEGYSLLLSRRAHAHGMDGKGSGSSKNPVILALMIENAADMLGVILALCGYGLFLLTGDPMWDGLFSLAIAGMLACTSLFLIRRNISLITGESAPDDVRNGIVDAAKSVDIVADVTEVVAVMAGPERVACRITVRLHRSRLLERWAAAKDLSLRPEEAALWTVDRLETERAAITAAIRDRLPHATDVVVICT